MTAALSIMRISPPVPAPAAIIVPPVRPALVSSKRRANILLVDDEPLVARAITRLLTAQGHGVHHVRDGATALVEATGHRFDVVLSDIHMPGGTGIEMLSALRARGCDIPVVLMTGRPEFETARDAVELGAMQYLTKPLTRDLLLGAIERACDRTDGQSSGRATMDLAAFGSVLGSVWMAFQPIVSLTGGGAVVAYEALVRSRDPSLSSPAKLFEKATSAGRRLELARAIRDRCAAVIGELPPAVSLFVNVDAVDLLDPELFSLESALARCAKDVVLEITEREALEKIADITERIHALRALGFRIAVDDLGAGYAGLSSIALLEPEYVKLDMSLTRNVAASPLKSRLVSSMIDVCRDLRMHLIAEGVESASEAAALRALGCDMAQGYHFGRPSAGFAPPVA